MTDVHTHILPGMDDGSRDEAMSIQMLSTQYEQGVDNIVLTPHFYRRNETAARFFQRRYESYNRLYDAICEANRDFPALYLAAEVAWAPNMSQWDELPDLCIEGTRNLMLEMPFTPWNRETVRQVYGIINRGITPVFVHLERFINDHNMDYINEVVSLGTPIQVNSTPILHFSQRKTVKNLIKNGCAHIMASDCHNMTTRVPNLPQGLRIVEKMFGHEAAQTMEENAESLLPVMQYSDVRKSE